ncbi:hypothetical protein DFS34DRAFT_646000 [Phlyctochytrium arcticum]|nr:hypothetical protein DFS34DRAFT_646000 [Phlyctochytrium arcticum]
MLALAMRSWQECREQLLSEFKTAAVNNPHATPVKKALIESIIWVFEEAIPLAVDAPYLLARCDLDNIRICLVRLFRLFVRLEKKNYVNITIFMMGLVEKLCKLLPEQVAALLATFSSQDLEVFHSVLRAVIRFQNSAAQVSRKRLLITAMEDDDAISQLIAMTEGKKEMRGQAASFTIQDGVATRLTPFEKAMENVVPTMKEHLLAMFSTLFTFSFEIDGKRDIFEKEKNPAPAGFFLVEWVWDLRQMPRVSVGILLCTPFLTSLQMKNCMVVKTGKDSKAL